MEAYHGVCKVNISMMIQRRENSSETFNFLGYDTVWLVLHISLFDNGISIS